MSRAGKSSERRPLDAYYTPDGTAENLVSLLRRPPSGAKVKEPSVGGGAFAKAILKLWPDTTLTGIDIDPCAAGLALCDEAVVGDYPEVVCGFADWTIGNPPFCDAEAHLEAALHDSNNVAFLLRLAFFESAKRVKRWRSWGPRLDTAFVLPKRISFHGGPESLDESGTFKPGKADKFAYAFFVFGPPGGANRGRVVVVDADFKPLWGNP